MANAKLWERLVEFAEAYQSYQMLGMDAPDEASETRHRNARMEEYDKMKALALVIESGYPYES